MYKIYILDRTIDNECRLNLPETLPNKILIPGIKLKVRANIIRVQQ